MKVGYVGLGNMGLPISERLASGNNLIVTDADHDMHRKIQSKNVIFVKEVGEVVGRSEVIFLCLPSSKQVKNVIFGANGIVENATSAKIIIDQSTGDPRITREMAAALVPKNLTLVDCPISGGPRGAREGTLLQLLGASVGIAEKLRSLLLQISPRIFHVGEVGSGHVAKIANNMISHAQRLLTLEVVAFASKNGVDPVLMGEIMSNGSAKNYYLENYFRSRVLEGNFEPSFTLDLLIKDVKLATDVGAVKSVPMPISNAVRQYYEVARGVLEEGVQADEVSRFIDQVSKTSVVGAAL